mmetsp:Transcript_74727/g.134654  ORF Transcript_74727/g.134654 Transcript_74727/m.134654 type:complete len:309 (+) Transcript_74727:48-974(+)
MSWRVHDLLEVRSLLFSRLRLVLRRLDVQVFGHGSFLVAGHPPPREADDFDLRVLFVSKALCVLLVKPSCHSCFPRDFLRILGHSLQGAVGDGHSLATFKRDEDLRLVDSSKDHTSCARLYHDRIHAQEVVRRLDSGANRELAVSVAPGPNLYRQYVETVWHTILGRIEDNCQPRVAVLGQHCATAARRYCYLVANQQCDGCLNLLCDAETANQQTLSRHLAEVDTHWEVWPGPQLLLAMLMATPRRLEQNRDPVLRQAANDGARRAKKHLHVLVQHQIVQRHYLLREPEATWEWCHQGFWKDVHAKL